jgi:hypothetical protein
LILCPAPLISDHLCQQKSNSSRNLVLLRRLEDGYVKSKHSIFWKLHWHLDYTILSTVYISRNAISISLLASNNCCLDLETKKLAIVFSCDVHMRNSCICVTYVLFSSTVIPFPSPPPKCRCVVLTWMYLLKDTRHVFHKSQTYGI